jgi:hypothetical protein
MDISTDVAAKAKVGNRAGPAKAGQRAARDPVADAMNSMLRSIRLAGADARSRRWALEKTTVSTCVCFEKDTDLQAGFQPGVHLQTGLTMPQSP